MIANKANVIAIISDRNKLCNLLERYRDSKWITCIPVPAKGKEYTEEELDNGNGCQGCGELYHDDDVMQITGAGPFCFNCLYNIVALVVSGDIDHRTK